VSGAKYSKRETSGKRGGFEIGRKERQLERSSSLLPELPPTIRNSKDPLTAIRVGGLGRSRKE